MKKEAGTFAHPKLSAVFDMSNSFAIKLNEIIRRSDGRRRQHRCAARSISEPGGIVLLNAVYEHSRDRLKEAFVDLGEKTFKNIARPVRVYAYRMIPNTAAPSVAPLEKREPPRFSLVVLPFASIGGDPSHEHFVDSVTESLTTDLSRMRGAVVIARNTAFAYKGKPLDVKSAAFRVAATTFMPASKCRGSNRLGMRYLTYLPKRWLVVVKSSDSYNS
jgi:hypothetical protein